MYTLHYIKLIRQLIILLSVNQTTISSNLLAKNDYNTVYNSFILFIFFHYCGVLLRKWVLMGADRLIFAYKPLIYLFINIMIYFNMSKFPI